MSGGFLLTSPYPGGLLKSLSSLESGLQAHDNFMRQHRDVVETSPWPSASRIMAGTFHPVLGESDEDTDDEDTETSSD